MNLSATAPNAPQKTSSHNYLWWLLIAATVAIFIIFRFTIAWMSELWETPEYSHAYMIPLVALFILRTKINQLPSVTSHGSWLGLALLAFGLAAFTIGELVGLRTFSQYGFLLSLFGLTLSFFGTSAMRLIWAAFAYLIFMIPLPSALLSNLSSQLQLVSSVIGVAVIRLFDISVHLEGNVIDLGTMQLQVAEACSGLRYLFPLMSFGFLIGYLYKGSTWKKVALFLSTIPITILMNSIRIGLIGVTVNYWGISMAEGFLHDFEGWVVFMGCLGVLFLEIYLFQLFSKNKQSVFDVLDIQIPRWQIKLADFNLNQKAQRPFIICCLLLLLSIPFLTTIKERQEIVPDRQTLNSLPLSYKGWTGYNLPLDRITLDTLKLTDYIQANYSENNNRQEVNFYIAWYASQKYGTGIHSPAVCIPGGGWKILQMEELALENIKHVSGSSLKVNRLVINKGNMTQLTYYWFEGRGRDLTGEYSALWFRLWDVLTRSRSDGALVRVVTSVPEGTPIAEADQRLQKFLADFYPLTPAYVP